MKPERKRNGRRRGLTWRRGRSPRWICYHIEPLITRSNRWQGYQFLPLLDTGTKKHEHKDMAERDEHRNGRRTTRIIYSKPNQVYVYLYTNTPGFLNYN